MHIHTVEFWNMTFAKNETMKQFVSWSMAEEICPKGCKVQAICLAFEISVNP